jgi:hypothetical protein
LRALVFEYEEVLDAAYGFDMLSLK